MEISDESLATGCTGTTTDIWVNLMFAGAKWVPPVSGYLFGDHLISKACWECLGMRSLLEGDSSEGRLCYAAVVMRPISVSCTGRAKCCCWCPFR